MFVLSFKNCNDSLTRDFFDECYISLVEIKDFNVLINNKPFFDHPVKNKQEVYEMSRHYDYTTGNLLSHFYYQNYYKRIDIDLSRQKNTSVHQQINFTGKLEKDDGVTMFLLLKSSKKLF